MARDKAEILAEIETLLVEYVQAGTEIESLMLDGFVAKVRCVDTARLEEQAEMGTTMWFGPSRQDVFKSIGLANALVDDVGRYYDGLFEDADLLNPDDD